MKKVALIIHGHRSLSKSSTDTIDLLENSESLRISQLKTTCVGDAINLAKMACADYDVIVAVGGDGTCNEVINGIMLAEPKEMQLGIIPNGTGNDFVRNLDGFSAESFVHKLTTGTGKKIDVGKISFKASDRYFLNVADIGFGAKVVETMSRQRTKGLGGKASYSLAILRTFFSYKKSVILARGGSIEFKGKALMLVFSNGATFGHGLKVFPDAKIDSGELGLVVIGNVSLYEYVKNLRNLKKGRKINHPEVHYHTFKRLVLESGEGVHAETDGEIAGKSSISVEVIPNALFLIC